MIDDVNKQKLQVLIELRKQIPLSQKEAAKRFGLEGRQSYKSFAAWELGDSIPNIKYRQEFIYYLWDTLRLRQRPEKFDEVWPTLVQIWNWRPLSTEERQKLPKLAQQENPTFTLSPSKSPEEQLSAPLVFVRSPLQGRTTELEKLLALYKKVEQKLPQIAIISGNTGVGKTRLLEEFLDQLIQQPITILRKKILVSQNLPLATVIELLHDAVKVLKQFEEKLPLEFWPLQRLIPELVPQSTSRQPSQLFELSQTVLFDTICRFLIYVAERRPLIIAIDDLHYADAETLILFSLLLNRIETGHTKLFVCITHNQDEVNSNSEFAKWLAVLNRSSHIHRIELNPLSLSQTKAMLTGILGQPLYGFVETLFNKTDGNPLLLEEILQSFVEHQHLVREQDTWVWKENELLLSFQGQNTAEPGLSRIKLVIEKRLDHLEETSRKALRIAALLGKQFNFELLLSVIRNGEDALLLITEDQVLDIIDDWLNKQLVEEKADGLFAFKHNITQTIAQQGTSEYRLIRLRLKVAETIERHYQDAPQKLDEHAELLTEYYRIGNRPKAAVEYALRAAHYAYARFAFSKTLQILGQIEAVITSNIDTNTLFAFYKLTGDSLALLGQQDKALDAYHQAFELSKLCEPPPPKNQIADLARQIGRQYGWKAEIDEALIWMDKARTILGIVNNQEEPRVLALIYVHTASLYYQKGEYNRTEELCQTALTILHSTDNNTVKGECYNLLGSVQHILGKLNEAHKALQSSLEIWCELGHKYELKRVENNLATLEFLMGEWGNAQIRFESVLPFFENVRDENRLTTALTNLGMLNNNRGDYDKAQAYHARALKIADKLGVPWLQSLVRVNLAWVYIQQCNWPQAETYARESIMIEKEHKLGRSLGEAHRILAEVAIGREEFQLASEEATMALKIAREQEDKLEEGTSERILGLAIHKLGQLESAQKHLNVSLAILEKLKNEFELALTYRQIAQLYFEVSYHEQALIYTCRALVIFVSLGAEGEIQKLRNSRTIFQVQRSLKNAIDICKTIMEELSWSFQSETKTSTNIYKVTFKYGEREVLFRLNQSNPKVTEILLLE